MLCTPQPPSARVWHCIEARGLQFPNRDNFQIIYTRYLTDTVPTEGKAILMARKVAVVGVGHSKFGRRTNVHITELAFESFKEALEDCGLRQKDIEFVSVGCTGAGGWNEEALTAPLLCEYLGSTPAGTVRCEAACATGSAAVHIGYHMIASGHVDIAMALGIEKMSEIDIPRMVDVGHKRIQ